MTYRYSVLENRDCGKIDKLNKLTKNVTSDHSIHRWECLADMRWNELITGCEDVRTEIDYGKPIRYFDRKTGKEVFAVE